jgi:hypothetical protein
MVNRAPSVTKSTQSIVSATSSERRRAAEKLLSGFDVSVADRGEAVIKRYRTNAPLSLNGDVGRNARGSRRHVA